MITKPVSKVEECLKQYFLFVRFKSIQVPFPLKHVFDLIMSSRLTTIWYHTKVSQNYVVVINARIMINNHR